MARGNLPEQAPAVPQELFFAFNDLYLWLGALDRDVRRLERATAFPVGALFIGVDATDPAELLGYGTWEPFSTGRFLVGIDPSDVDFNPVLKTGGAKTANF